MIQRPGPIDQEDARVGVVEDGVELPGLDLAVLPEASLALDHRHQ